MSHEVKKMNQPSKKQFFEYMSETFGYEFSCERSYELLRDVIREAKDNPENLEEFVELKELSRRCLLYTSPSPRDLSTSRMPSSA